MDSLNKFHGVVGVSGYGHSGSSAAFDLLREIDSVCTIPTEFDIFKMPGGLVEIGQNFERHNIGSFNVSIASFYKLVDHFCQCRLSHIYHEELLNEFKKICYGFVDSIVSVTSSISCHPASYWYPHHIVSKFDVIGVPTIFRKLLRIIYRSIKLFSVQPSKENKYTIYLPKNVSYQKYVSLAKECIYRMLTCLSNDEKYEYIGLDNIFPAPLGYQGVLECLDYFDKIRIISVYRDPRDQYVQGITTGSQWMFVDQVENFIKYYAQGNLLHICDKRILHIKFEDLVINYSDTVDKIFNFLNLKKLNHIHKFKFFNPKESIKNINLWHGHKDQQSINKITASLEDFLYRSVA